MNGTKNYRRVFECRWTPKSKESLTSPSSLNSFNCEAWFPYPSGLSFLPLFSPSPAHLPPHPSHWSTSCMILCTPSHSLGRDGVNKGLSTASTPLTQSLSHKMEDTFNVSQFTFPLCARITPCPKYKDPLKRLS